MLTLSDMTQEFQDMFHYLVETQIKHLGGKRNHGLYYSALDSLDDVAQGFHEFWNNSSNPSIIECLGFMQALYIQQDSVKVLAKIFGLEIVWGRIPELDKVRKLRNRICGHPANATHGGFSTSFFPRMGRTREYFQAIVQYEEKWETETIVFKDIRKRNEIALTKQMLLIRDLAEAIEANMFQEKPPETIISGKKLVERGKPWRTDYRDLHPIKPIKIDASSWLLNSR